MLAHTLGAGVAVGLSLLLGAAGHAADRRVDPAWMKVNAAAKQVSFDVIAGFNANNGALNFNGYFSGDATIVVPVGWVVEIDFKNNDAMLPHSLLVTKPYAPDQVPDLAGVDEVAIPRAYSDNPEEGIPASKTDTMRFLARNPGDYYFFCGAPGHGKGGMWTKFKVDAAADAPYVSIADRAEPGRP
jgi:hypothetical protein